MSYSRSMAVMAALWLVVGAASSPVRRSPDLEARRRSAIDRSMIRFGRAYPREPSAAELREAFQLPSHQGSAFFDRPPLTLTADNMESLLRSYEQDNDSPVSKRSSSFVRFGRDPAFIRFGRSSDAEKNGYERNSESTVSKYPQRINRARNHFIRLGRDNEEWNDVKEFEDVNDIRRKRAAETCHDCQS